MNTKTMGMFALLIIALSVVGFAYAHWTDLIKINGVVSTGSMTVGFTEIVREWDKEDWLTFYGQNPEGKDVGDTFCWLDEPLETDVHTNKTVYKKLWCYVNNSYGDYWGINKFTIDNAGTIPVVISNVTLTYNASILSVRVVIPDMVWEFTDINTSKVAFNVWLYKEPPDYGPGWEIAPPWDFPAPWPEALIGNQIDPQPEFVANPWVNMTDSELLTELCVHVKQSAPQCHTWYFDIEIEFVNWDP